MSNSWHKTSNDLEAENNTTAFWNRHSEELSNGEFWADRIKKYKGEPAKRLKLALENMPLPASFREAAIATRALIRGKRKERKSYDEQLYLLYWLAAVDSFSVPYSEKLKEPGYNVIESIPGEKLKALPFSYKDLGYTGLTLLNKTDVKWLIEAWGEPESHSTLHKLHFDVWEEYEDKLKIKRSSDPFSLSVEAPESVAIAQVNTKPEAIAQIKSNKPETTTPIKSGKKLLLIVGGIIAAALVLLGKS